MKGVLLTEEAQERPGSRDWLRSPVWPILFIAALAALIISSALGRPLINLGSSKPGKAYKNYTAASDDGFSLQYPRDWRVLSREELAKFQGVFAFAAQSKKPTALFSVKVQNIKTKAVNLGQVGRALDKAMPKNFPRFKKLGQQLTTVNGRQALDYEYTFVSNEGLAVKERLTVIPAGDKVFHLTSWASVKNFSRVKPDFDRIVAGFTVQ